MAASGLLLGLEWEIRQRQHAALLRRKSEAQDDTEGGQGAPPEPSGDDRRGLLGLEPRGRLDPRWRPLHPFDSGPEPGVDGAV